MPFHSKKSDQSDAASENDTRGSGDGNTWNGNSARIQSTHIEVTADSVCYHRKIDRLQSLSFAGSAPRPAASPFQEAVGLDFASDRFLDTNAEAVLEQLNVALKQPAYAIAFVLGGVLLGIGLAFLHPLLFLPTFVVGMILAAFMNQRDKKRRDYRLEYHFDEGGKRRWAAMNAALTSLARSSALWQITPRNPDYDWKRNTGSNTLLNRLRITVAPQAAVSLLSNVTPYCLRLGSQELFFFPDRLYIYHEETYRSIDYDALNLSTGQALFIEEDEAPSDASIVGSTWQHVDSNGGPDRRFENNRKIPIANYGVIEFQAASGLHVLLSVSSLTAAYQFGALYPQSRVSTAHPAPHPQARRQQSPPHPKPQPPSAPPPAPLPRCYQVLALRPPARRRKRPRSIGSSPCPTIPTKSTIWPRSSRPSRIRR